MMQKTRNIRLTDRDFDFLSGFTNLGASNNLVLIIDMMRKSPMAITTFLDYLQIQDKANICTSEGKTLFVDYQLYEVDKIDKLENRLKVKTYRERNKSNDDEMPEHHKAIFAEMKIEANKIKEGVDTM